MGANTFFTESLGVNAQAAFNNAVREAQHEHGHGGYTGTIAEKSSFVMIDPGVVPAMAYAEQLIDEGDERVDDKWGPAGCIELAPGRYLFFGWASS